MAIEIGDFHQEFFQEIIAAADAEGRYVEDAFFELFCSYLIDAGELDMADRVPYAPVTGGRRVDGYGGDPAQSAGVLSLIIADFSHGSAIGRLTQSDMNDIFKRLSNFLTKALDSKFRNSLEETNPAFGLADLIATRWANTTKVRLFLISNRALSSKVDGREAGEIDGKSVTYSVWDIERLYRFAAAGMGREPIEIDLADHGGPIPLLPAHLSDAGYQAYLAVVPGEQLASIYDRWGARLLEQNVRVFLQARGGVNKGIRNTIEHDAEMFFAYNNGVTATAESIKTSEVGGALLLNSLQNLQIVNGGQTTASIHAASRRKSNLSKVFVQMKLSIVPAEHAIDIVPKISEFANSQNRVNAADFFSNHPFHVRVEEFSRRIFAPSPDGTFRESKWFYERARGQYPDARALLSPSQRRKFDLEYPKGQLFTKEDLAKYINLWRGAPDTVSKGKQKNFAVFAGAIGREWAKQSDDFNEEFYRQSIAKGIVFKETEALLTDERFKGGKRAFVVAYAIAKLASDVEDMGLAVDLERIWKTQKITDAMKSALVLAAEHAHEVLASPPIGISLLSEWAKQQGCWARVKALKIAWPDEWRAELIGKDEQRAIKRSAVKDQKMLNGIEAQSAVVMAGAEFWSGLAQWGKSKNLLTPTETGILAVAASVPGKIPTERQAMKAVEAFRKLRSEGCQLGANLKL